MPKLLADGIIDIRDAAQQAPQQAPQQTADPQPPHHQQAPQTQTQLQPSQAQPEGLVKIRLPEGDGVHNIDAQNERNLDAVSRVMKKYPGKYQAIIYYPQGGSRRTGEGLWVTPCDAFAKEIEEVVGKGNYKS